jgi:hypothetical protein
MQDWKQMEHNYLNEDHPFHDEREYDEDAAYEAHLEAMMGVD